MAKKVCITYTVTTDESASEGEWAEHGWWMPGGWEYPLEDSEGYHEKTLEQAKNGSFLMSLSEGIKASRDLGIGHEVTILGNSLTACSVDPPCDRAYIEEGEERRYTLHVSGYSASSLKRIKDLLTS